MSAQINLAGRSGMRHLSGAKPKDLDELRERLRVTCARREASYRQAQATYADACAAWQRARSIFESAQDDALRRRLASGARQGQLWRSPDVRLLARFETMPTVEQAKGIIMAQSGCTATAAFDVLRQASQRLDIPVRDLAAQIVAHVSQTAVGPDGRLTPFEPPQVA